MIENSIKSAQANHHIHELLKERWSPRSFEAKDIDLSTLNSILEAARWAPSAFNEQPWRFITVRKSENTEFESLLRCLMPFNQIWASKAPLLLVCCSKRNFSHNGKTNHNASYDLGQAVAALTFQALSMGIYVHQMAGFDNNMLREKMSIDEDYQINTVIALGYLGKPEQLPDDMKKTELQSRERKNISELLL